LKRVRASRAASRLRAPAASASAPPCIPRFARHPRPRTFPRPSRAPRRLGVLPAPRVGRHLHRTTVGSAPHGPPVRPMPLPVRAPAEVPAVPQRHLRRHSVVTGKPRPYIKAARPPRARHARATRHGRCLKQAPVPEPFRCRPTPLTPSLPHTRALAPACWQAQAPLSPEPRPPRLPPPGIAVRRCRLPLSSNFERKRALGEHTHLPALLPGRERRRPRRNWPEPRRPHPQGPHCKA
jgi:hypothetical protein